MLEILNQGSDDSSWQDLPVEVYQKESIFKEGDGIYLIEHIASGTEHTVYVNDTADGGGWMLLVNYTNTPEQRNWKDLVQVGTPLKPYDQIKDTKLPCLKPIPLNDFDQWLYASANTSWKGLYGGYLIANNIPPGVSEIANKKGIRIRSELGDKRIYGNKGGWNVNNKTAEEFGLWTTYGNGGPCGGANIPGPNRICTIMSAGNAGVSLHGDTTSVKRIYIRDTTNTKVRKIQKIS